MPTTDEGGPVTPSTQAGRRLIDWLLMRAPDSPRKRPATPLALRIVAIEREAAAAAEAQVRHVAAEYERLVSKKLDATLPPHAADCDEGFTSGRCLRCTVLAHVSVAYGFARPLLAAGDGAVPAGRLASIDALRRAIGTTGAGEGLEHWHHASGGTGRVTERDGVFVDRQQVLDTIERVLR